MVVNGKTRITMAWVITSSKVANSIAWAVDAETRILDAVAVGWIANLAHEARSRTRVGLALAFAATDLAALAGAAAGKRLAIAEKTSLAFRAGDVGAAA